MEELVSSILMSLGLVGIGLAQAEPSAQHDVPRMTQRELEDRLDDEGLTTIDLRQPGEWQSAATKIKGAVRENPLNVDEWAGTYSLDQTLVLYCS